MVSEDLDDFSVEVVEFGDGTKVKVEETDFTSTETSVNPADRFTDDYDRSYPPKPIHHPPYESDQQQHHIYKPTNYRRSEDHGYNNTRYNNSVHGYDHRRHSNDNRRSSYDRKSSTNGLYQPTTLLTRPRRSSEHSFKSDHSREDIHIPEPIVEAEKVTAVQREVMLTAAERAKKRRDEEEADFEAARVRARQKADALALLAEKNNPPVKMEKENKPIVLKASPKEKKSILPKESPKLPDTSKPWNLVVGKKEITIEKRPETAAGQEVNDTKAKSTNKTKSSMEATLKQTTEPVKPHEPRKFDDRGNPLNKDDQMWEKFVHEVKVDSATLSSKSNATSNDWNSFATRLQKSEVDKKKAHNAKYKESQAVEVLDYADLEKQENDIQQGQSRGWVLGQKDGVHARTTSAEHTKRQAKSNTNWRPTSNESVVVTEILKHEPPAQKPKVKDLFKESSSPIFPEAIQKLVGKKPANISFMIDVDESDKDITVK